MPPGISDGGVLPMRACRSSGVAGKFIIKNSVL